MSSPPGTPVVGAFSCFLTRDQPPSRKRRAGEKTRPSSLFYGNSRTKFPLRLNLPRKPSSQAVLKLSRAIISDQARILLWCSTGPSDPIDEANEPASKC
jgi:hypothetical protein